MPGRWAKRKPAIANDSDYALDHILIEVALSSHVLFKFYDET